ncbi:hypothetical protein ACJIZ3_003300 [Penstemon smallii]|uniref:WAT1-related protein n=1 Tax=Penstemon smallii TaxID=265156 RepID=A0ABD3U8U8_9LAMI
MELKFANKVKIYLAVILLQFGFAGFAIVAKFAVYRNAIAAVVFAPLKTRPKMTYNILLKIILLLGLLKQRSSCPHFCNGLDTKVLNLPAALMIAAGNFGYSLFYILQAITLKSYPVGHTLTTLICTTEALQGTILTFAVERGNSAIWSIGWDSKLLAYGYGVFTYYISGIIMGKKGPVFVTAFNRSFIFAEQLDVGKVIGAVVIVIGLYLVIWGKSKDQSESIDTKLELRSYDHKQVLVTNS